MSDTTKFSLHLVGKIKDVGRPLLVYFVSGIVEGEFIIALEDELQKMFPNRYTSLIHVDFPKQKEWWLENMNVEELEKGLVDVLWKNAENAVEDDEND
jgi:hypothetical protein